MSRGKPEKICRNCGEKNHVRRKSCTKCGQDFYTVSTKPIEGEKNEPTEETQAEENTEDAEPASEESTTKNTEQTTEEGEVNKKK